MQLVEALVAADYHYMSVLLLGEQVAQQGRKLEVEGVLAAYSYFQIFDISLCGHHLAVHLKADGIGILAVEDYDLVILGQLFDACDAFGFYVFKVDQICFHQVFPSHDYFAERFLDMMTAAAAMAAAAPAPQTI